ncbi:MAG: hypothetical protein L0154_00820 [Chloroflexi bacterium]|nr:hypothetical protein [Chloroflexota bacterium]
MTILLQPQSQNQLNLVTKTQPSQVAFNDTITPYSPPQALHYPLLALLLDSTHQDVEYISNYSFLLDIQILLMTIQPC